jgi:putative ABC transport system permease protein
LVTQFLVESVMTALFALLLSIGFIAIFLSTFNGLSGKSISFLFLFKPDTILILLGVVLFVGLVGGSYPAFYLSKFNPVSILKGSLAKSSSNATLRRVLVVVQFSISMIMLICTWVVYGQLKYLRNKDMGFNKDQVLTISANANRDIRSNIIAFRNEIEKDPKVLAVSASQSQPGGQNISFNLFSVPAKEGTLIKGCFAME